MLQAGDFKLTAVRLVAFTPNHADFKQSAALAAVLGTYGKRFDGEVQAIPLPNEVPPDFPRIQLTSTDGHWGFAASPSRITTSWQRRIADESVVLESVATPCREPIEHHVNENDVQVGRLAIVVTRACQAEDAAKTLIDRFCRDEMKDTNLRDAPLRNSRSFEIHNHKRYDLGAGLTINSWVRCRTGIMGEDAVPVVTVEQDLNSLADEIEERRFDVEQIGDFYNMGVSEVDEILCKYFP